MAVRNAVSEARQQLDGEFGEEIREFSKPLAELNNVRQMGARGFITKTLFDGDESYLNSLDETKNQFRDTVESVRQPSLRDALRGAGAEVPRVLPLTMWHATTGASLCHRKSIHQQIEVG